MSLLNSTAIGSLVAQLVTGAIELSGLFFDVKPEDTIVKDVLAMELSVQIVELAFYLFLVYKIMTKTLEKDITGHRYIDWVITTPFMLISLIVFFKHLKEPDRKIRLLESMREEKTNILLIICGNLLMLLFGYFGEIGLMNNGIAVALGFIPFAFIFKQLYANYVSKQNISIHLFYFVFGIWSLYGVAAMLPFILKNSFYNILDLFAKNAYGLFLYFYLRQIQL
jgi:bacteriorhodopsin